MSADASLSLAAAGYDAPRYYFAHVPKTGGTSFIPLLDSGFHADDICPAQLWSQWPQVTGQRFRLIRGHFGGRSPAGEAEMLTMLRSPPTLMASTLAFIRREPGTRLHERARAASDVEFLCDHAADTGLGNRQVGHLSFDGESGGLPVDSLYSEASAQVVRDRCAGEYRRLGDAEALERAWSRVESTVWFGLIERFQEALHLLAYRFGLPVPRETHRARQASRETETVLRSWRRHEGRVEELSRLDRELYRRAQALFEKRLAAIDRVHVLMRYSRPAPPWRYEFAQPLLGSGWHRRERKTPEGDWFRWTGPGRSATLRLPAPVGCRAVRVRVVNAASAAHLAGLKLYAGRALLPIAQNPDDDLVTVLEASLAQCAFGDEVELRLETPEPVANPYSDEDDRLIGVAVHWIEFDV